MEYLRIFAEEHHLTETNGAYAGVYEDMFISVRETENELVMHIALDMPRGAKKEQLMQALSEKQERFRVKVSESANANVLVFTFVNDPTAVSRMERFVSECDVLLRPYGREMGILCGRCRTEIHEEDAWEIQYVDGELLPVCSACASGANAKGVNRNTIKRSRAKKGIVGALIGMLISSIFMAILGAVGMSGYLLPTFAVGYILNRFYDKFGGLNDKWGLYMLVVCAVFSIILSEILVTVGSLVYFLKFTQMDMEYIAELLGNEGIMHYALSVFNQMLLSPSTWMAALPNIFVSVISVFVFRRK